MLWWNEGDSAGTTWPKCWKLLKSSNFGSVLEHDWGKTVPNMFQKSKVGETVSWPWHFWSLGLQVSPRLNLPPYHWAGSSGEGRGRSRVGPSPTDKWYRHIGIRCLKWGDKTWQWEIHVFVAKPFGNDPLVIFHRQISFMEGPCLQFAWGSSELERLTLRTTMLYQKNKATHVCSLRPTSYDMSRVQWEFSPVVLSKCVQLLSVFSRKNSQK